MVVISENTLRHGHNGYWKSGEGGSMYRDTWDSDIGRTYSDFKPKPNTMPTVKDRPLKEQYEEGLYLVPKSGTYLRDAIAYAINTANNLQSIVAFEFNGVLVRCDPGAKANHIYAQYHKTHTSDKQYKKASWVTCKRGKNHA